MKRFRGPLGTDSPSGLRSLPAVSFLALVLLATFAGCRSDVPATPHPDAPQGALATFRGGSVTVPDILDFIGALPAENRRPPSGDTVAWYEEIARNVAFDRIVFDEAELLGADRAPGFAKRKRNIRRQVYSAHHLATEGSGAVAITEEDLQAAYDANPDRFRRQEYRELYHIYRRFGGDTPREAVLGEVEELRGRIEGGESFTLLAREHSESESRHSGGRLGLLTKGRLPAPIEEAAFALEERKVSAPIVRPDGVHLLWNENTSPALEIPFAEARSVLRRELVRKGVHETLLRLADSLGVPEGSYFLEREELVELLRKDSSDALVLGVGAYSLRLREFRALLGEQQKGSPERQEVWSAYESLRARELIYQHMLANNLPRDVDLEPEIREATERYLVETRKQEKMRHFVDAHPEVLEKHFRVHAARFLTMPRVRLRRLSVERGVAGAPRMARLESAVEDLNAGRFTLEELADELNGRLEEVGWATPRELTAIDPRAARLAFRMSAGEHSYPYSLNDRLWVFEVVESAPPQDVGFNVARKAVTTDYLKHKAQEVHRQVMEDSLVEREFRFFPGAVSEDPLADLNDE